MMVSLVSEESCVFCKNPLHEAVLETTLEGTASPRTFRLLRCGGCGLMTTTPHLPKSELEAYYQAGYWGHAAQTTLPGCGATNGRARLSWSASGAKGRLLDVGCGLGLFLLALDPRRWDRYGLERMPRLPGSGPSPGRGPHREGRIDGGRISPRAF